MNINFVVFLATLAVSDSATIAGRQFPVVEVHELLGLLTHGVLNIVGECNGALENVTIQFALYNRRTPETGIILTTAHVDILKTNRPLVVIIHGWLSSIYTAHPIALKDAYLRRDDYNVVMVDWSKSASTLDYGRAICMLPFVGETIGMLLCAVDRDQTLDWSRAHLVGHSLGAHIAGHAGSAVQKRCRKSLGRITGLDPAGPGFQYKSNDLRLDSGDAEFVDVIHTSQGITGYFDQAGTVDFYVNCGAVQNGCTERGETIPVLGEIEMTISAALCNHERSWEYYIESVNSNRFRAVSCWSCPWVCKADFSETDVVMGENCSRNSSMHKNYILETDQKSPYALG